MGAHLQSLAKKMERAYRNHTGVKLTVDELVTLGEMGIFETVQKAKAQEMLAICRAKLPLTSSEISGSTSGATANPPTFGKSPATTPALDRSAIKALVAGR